MKETCNEGRNPGAKTCANRNRIYTRSAMPVGAQNQRDGRNENELICAGQVDRIATHRNYWASKLGSLFGSLDYE